MKSLKPIKLYEEFEEDDNFPNIECAYYEKNDPNSPHEYDILNSKYLISSINSIPTIIEEFSLRPDDLAGISLEIWTRTSNLKFPQLLYFSHITKDIFNLPNVVDKTTWSPDAHDTMNQSLKLMKKSYRLNKPILSILKGYENQTYVANPLWNRYWEEGLTKLVTEICPLEECDEITQNEIGRFALVNNMESIIAYIIDKNIASEISANVKDIAGAALKGNHKLR